MKEKNLIAIYRGMKVYARSKVYNSPQIRAGTGDRLIFRLILSKLGEHLDAAEREIDNDFQAIIYEKVGANIISLFHCPFYSWWDERELRLLKEELGARR